MQAGGCVRRDADADRYGRQGMLCFLGNPGCFCLSAWFVALCGDACVKRIHGGPPYLAETGRRRSGVWIRGGYMSCPGVKPTMIFTVRLGTLFVRKFTSTALYVKRKSTILPRTPIHMLLQMSFGLDEIYRNMSDIWNQTYH
jgi:hypothetical protein